MPLNNQQRRIRLLVLALGLLLLLVLGAGFYLGQHAAYSGMGIDPEVYRAMQEELPQARERSRALAAELDVERTRHEVNRGALEILRREMAGQNEHVADLEEALQFYRSLMAPGEINQGLSLRAPELVAREEERRFGFRIVAQQEARKHQLLKGSLAVEVFGLQGRDPVSLPLSQLWDQADAEALALRFRYFQAIEGEITLPEDFVPRGLRIVATATTPRKVEVRADYPWQVQERFTHVGK